LQCARHTPCCDTWLTPFVANPRHDRTRHTTRQQDYYKAVMAEMYVDGAGMRGGGGGGFRAGYGGGAAYMGGGGGYANGARGPMDPNAAAAAAAAGGPGNGYEAGPSNVLRLRGLPFSAQKEDIVRWFEDVQITPLLPDK
jgi:hypothetical protein